MVRNYNANVLTFFINLFLCLLLSNLSKRNRFINIVKRVAISAELEVEIITHIHVCVHTVLFLVLANA